MPRPLDLPLAVMTPDLDPVGVLAGPFPSAAISVDQQICRRNSTLFVCIVEGHGRRVVKYGSGLDHRTAQGVADNTAEFGVILERAGSPIRPINSTVTTTDPVALVSEFIDGVDLSVLLSEVVSTGRWRLELDETAGLIRECGRALAVLHRDVHIPATGTEILSVVAARLHLPSQWLVDAESLARPVCSAGDFSAPNFRVDPSGHLYMLDITAERVRTTAHADCALFLSSLARCYYGLPFRHLSTYPRAYRRHRAAFLDGYATGGLFEADRDRHLALIEWIVGYYDASYVAKLVRRRATSEWRAVGAFLPRLAARGGRITQAHLRVRGVI